jgi:hypothetical protein
MSYFGGCPRKSGTNVHLNIGPYYFHPCSFKVCTIIYTIFSRGLLYSQITYPHGAGYTFWDCLTLTSYQDPAATFGQCHHDPNGSPAHPLHLNCSSLILLKLPSPNLIYNLPTFRDPNVFSNFRFVRPTIENVQVQRPAQHFGIQLSNQLTNQLL